MAAERDSGSGIESPWQEAFDLLRFVAEAAALGLGIVLLAWILS